MARRPWDGSVYVTLRDPSVPRRGPEGAAGAAGRRVGSTVVLLGLVSFFTDISSEMVAAVLPLYLTAAVGLTPLAFGVIDGIQQGFSAFVRLAAGIVGDRRHRYKGVAAAGYGLSALSRLLLVLVPAGAGTIAGIVAVDRTGKGIRTAPRDAMIALAAPPGRTGAAFGVHRALDGAGAALGPILAFVVLLVTVDDYRSVFVCSLGMAVVGLAVLSLVRDPAATPTVPVQRAPRGPLLASLRGTGLWRVCLGAGLLALATVSDAFLFLTVQEQTSLDPRWFPLLFVGTAGTYAALAVPAGRLSDRFGAVPVFLAGHLLLLLGYCLLAPSSVSLALALVVVVLLGAYYAATDGVLMTLVARNVPERARGTAMGAVQTAVASGRLLSSVLFGAVWWQGSPGAALILFGVVLALVLPVAAVLLRGSDRRGPTVVLVA